MTQIHIARIVYARIISLLIVGVEQDKHPQSKRRRKRKNISNWSWWKDTDHGDEKFQAPPRHFMPRPQGVLGWRLMWQWSWKVSMFRYSKQSCAKRHTFDFTASGRSFMWHRKSNGPSSVPWGTSKSTATSFDASPSSTTLIFCFVKKLVSHW